MADGLDQALREEVATKSDVVGLRHEINLLRVEFRNDRNARNGDACCSRHDAFSCFQLNSSCSSHLQAR